MPLSRRSFITGSAAAAASAAIARLTGHDPRSLVDASLAAAPEGASSLGDIEHVVLVMQENRSFDHYFGTLSGVRGYSDRDVLKQQVGSQQFPIWDQFGFKPGVGADAAGYLQPFHLLNDPPEVDGDTTNDITHSWGPQHQSSNGGTMNGFVTSHLANDGPQNGPVTMGYYDRSDLAFYYALADAYTICDGYHCSVLGPTDPNRLMWVSATIDPTGENGGPVVETYTNRASEYGALSWQTMPECLTEAGVSWKVYNDPTSLLELSPLPYFSQFFNPRTAADVHNSSLALGPTYPASFVADVAAGTLPSVSWIMSPLAECEHPAAPPQYGEYLVSEILATLVSNPDVWAKTVMFVVYDENGGFFDHVAPPAAPAGTAGEWLTSATLPAAASGIDGPVGLGFRVPCLVVSPFSAGGWYCPDTFDHTSLLRFLEARFGVEVPNLSTWRRSVTGDLTTALPLATPSLAVPALPPTSLGDTTVAEEAVINALAGTEDVGVAYPPPTSNSMPAQEKTPKRKRTKT